MKSKAKDKRTGVRSSGNVVTGTRGARVPRQGWEEAFRRFGTPAIIAEPAPTEFDREEWTWR